MKIYFGVILVALGIAEVTECLECFNCTNISDPQACATTTLCSHGESCFLQTIHSGSDNLFNMGCQSNQMCSVGHNSIIGRSVQTIQQSPCHECCSTDGCNEQLCAHRKPSACIDDVTMDCAHLNSIINVCADIHHAKSICPRFCGLCNLVDGNWAEWGTWSSCSVTCDNGTYKRTRTCTNPSPSNGGLNCSGSASDTQMCSRQLCPVHGNWSEWSSWSSCSVYCDVGLIERTRTCTNPRPDRFGDNCYGDASDHKVCIQDPCSEKNGGWTNWGAWESCSVTCGIGSKLRHRACTNPSPSAYGKACEGDYKDFDVCVKTPCYVIAFNAHGFNVLSNLVNVFSTIVANEGKAYNASTGHFTAPVDGIYYFEAHFCVYYTSTINFYIEKGSASMSPKTRLTSTRGYHGSYGCNSASTSVKLNRNEDVWVYMASQYSSSYIYESSDDWNTFSGALIQAL
ncbi:hemicentin-1-like [Dreissena polymorpha]|uniref:C1q domain-containing protein n=1 Tax=Dreissena polymorpha TaxID=45954 RepID=A0A9D4IJD3_DREPO|nr:hemicentin-1-like [Dreissena polymorpha]KAH3773853.1 hypothetical protein DPMN_175224 [Dreissena polymorpha]